MWKISYITQERKTISDLIGISRNDKDINKSATFSKTVC